MKYDPRKLDKKWQQVWRTNNTYKTGTDPSKPKCYVLDMFPYPSGSGLHVGHPLGYIASDIYARFKRQTGHNVLHPMGFDAFGLPAEQYAIQSGVHPTVSTKDNTDRYREQMHRLALSFDWEREVNTSDPKYYKWTQYIFGLLFEHYYDLDADKPKSVNDLRAAFAAKGSSAVNAAAGEEIEFSAADWNAMSAREQSDTLMNYRLAYRSTSYVNWCEELGTVLANDQIKDGRSERGNFPVVQRPMEQWSLRITAYADRLLNDLQTVGFSEGLKAQQSNWIGKSIGAQAFFDIEGHDEKLEVFTTRPDTIFGTTFMVLAPEHDLVEQLTTADQKEEIDQYLEYVGTRSELDRQAENKVSGAFTGSYCINPLSGARAPIYIAEYVLKDYGTGAIMAVPSDDDRDKRFAEHFGLDIIDVVDKSDYPGATLKDKVGKLINSDFLNGMEVPEAIKAATKKLEELGRGKQQVNFRIRDLVFSRQRYWGEPFPIIYDEDGVPHLIDLNDLPVSLPPMEDFRPISGESPLARAKDWLHPAPGMTRETDTMPATAGSAWYYLRYMDPQNGETFASEEAMDYWQDVDLYVGGAEHAVAHLLYSRLWHKFLYDLGKVPTSEPYKKLVNQGMIGGPICYIHLAGMVTEDGQRHQLWVSSDLAEGDEISIDGIGSGRIILDEATGRRLNPLRYTTEVTVDKNQTFRIYRSQVEDAQQADHPDASYFRTILQQGETFAWRQDEEGSDYIELSFEQGKMSKRKYNAVNPDDICDRYGADCFRMYEMFLGPVEQGKPWSTSGIDGVFRFLRRFWSMFHTEDHDWNVSNDEVTKEEMKVLHTLIKKVTADIDELAHNTCVSAFMVATNDLIKLKCNKRSVLEPMVQLLAPFAPAMTDELWQLLGHDTSVHLSGWPASDDKWLVEDSKTYPVAFNGKTRFTLDLPADADKKAVEEMVMANEQTAPYLDGKTVRKVIVVPGRMVNIVVG
ncbi:leucine--tRNA ligase [Lewinellaceae bacterium SD302]|nr:leucine--tRNA ligase [Lewinellaceae bacterium SD302]